MWSRARFTTLRKYLPIPTSNIAGRWLKRRIRLWAACACKTWCRDFAAARGAFAGPENPAAEPIRTPFLQTAATVATTSNGWSPPASSRPLRAARPSAATYWRWSQEGGRSENIRVQRLGRSNDCRRRRVAGSGGAGAGDALSHPADPDRQSVHAGWLRRYRRARHGAEAQRSVGTASDRR